VISLSGPRAFGAVHAWRAMPRLRVPVLLVAAADDEPFAGAARAMYHRTARPRVTAAVRRFIMTRALS
jgi:hypothetical protein